jgi:biotin synthase
MSFENRIRCIKDLGELGYQTGSGNLIGLPGQTVESVAEDIQFFKKTNLDMVSTGPFIPNENTPLALTKPADIEFALKALATARIVTKNAHIPANTAYASLKDSDSRPRALKAGANVIMPNFTPPQYRGFYEIYPDKRCLKEPYENWLAQVKRITENLNWSIDYSRADTLKKENNGKITPVLLN